MDTGISIERVKAVPAITKRSKYDWAAVFDGELNKITVAPGKNPRSFATLARNAAEQRDIELLTCAVRDGDNGGAAVYIQSKA